MRILIENGSHHLQNLGDLAMLQVAVNRFNKIFNKPEIYTVCDVDQQELETKLPGVIAVRNKIEKGKLNSISRKLSNLIAGHEYAFNAQVIDLVEGCDLVVTAGGGYHLVDAFKHTSMRIADLLGLAHTLGKPTAILGHGFGTSTDKEFNKKLGRWLPKVDVINIREGVTSIDSLYRLGVDANRVVINTGDDAIELAYGYHQKHDIPNPQDAIGVNIRLSGYSYVNNGAVSVIKNVLHGYSQAKGMSLAACPISLVKEESDLLSTESMGISAAYSRLNTPELVIKQIARCKFVVTGSYHAAVFALSQGIPVIGLSASEYYDQKFKGLLNQFTSGALEAGCIVKLNSHYLRENLTKALVQVSEFNDNYRHSLLKCAEKQINTGYKAYNRIASLTLNK